MGGGEGRSWGQGDSSAPAASQELTALYLPREFPHSSDEMRTMKAFWKQEIQQTILNVSEGPRREVGGGGRVRKEGFWTVHFLSLPPNSSSSFREILPLWLSPEGHLPKTWPGPVLQEVEVAVLGKYRQPTAGEGSVTQTHERNGNGPAAEEGRSLVEWSKSDFPGFESGQCLQSILIKCH